MSISNDLKRKNNDKVDNENETGPESLTRTRPAYEALKDIDIEDSARKPTSLRSNLDKFETEYEVPLFSPGKGLYSSFDPSFENIDLVKKNVENKNPLLDINESISDGLK